MKMEAERGRRNCRIKMHPQRRPVFFSFRSSLPTQFGKMIGDIFARRYIYLDIADKLYTGKRYLSIPRQFRNMFSVYTRPRKKAMFREQRRIKEVLRRFRSSRTLKREIKVVRSYWVTAETFEVSNFENFVGEPARASQYQQKRKELA